MVNIALTHTAACLILPPLKKSFIIIQFNEWLTASQDYGDLDWVVNMTGCIQQKLGLMGKLTCNKISGILDVSSSTLLQRPLWLVSWLCK